MSSLFHPESKAMRIGSKLADLMILQIAVLLASLPIITAGAAFSAMHYTLLKLYRNQERGVWKEFWQAFRTNFRQSTVIWLIYIGVFLFLYIDLRLIFSANLPYLNLIIYFLPIPVLLGFLSLSWVFVLQSRYENTVFKTLRHSLLMILSQPLYSLINLLLMAAPLILLSVYPATIPFIFFLGFTLPGFIRAILYSRIFDRLEGTDWRKQQTQDMIEGE